MTTLAATVRETSGISTAPGRTIEDVELAATHLVY